MKLSALYVKALLLGGMLLICSIALAQQRFTVIEDFESGSVSLFSWLDEDIQPSAFSFDTQIVYPGSSYSLKLSGNTWKEQFITPVAVDTNAVWQVAGRTQSGARIQGIGFRDGTNTLFYSFSGSATLNIEQWVPVYQGAYAHNNWNLYKLPIADDWWSFFEYLPIITSIIYVNDLDGTSNRSVWFDNIYNISDEIPQAPQVSISYQIVSQRIVQHQRQVQIQFDSTVIDVDSSVFTYYWDFGDSTSSTIANPLKTFTVSDDRPWRVTLKVTDSSGKWGLASTMIAIDEGEGTLPVKLNFIGDVMLARRYEQAGGIIPTQGVNAIFEPTRQLLGGAADITVANLEVALTNQGVQHPTKSVVYRGNPNNVNGLVHAGIDIVSLANNHTLDYGNAGLIQTQQVLNSAGILHSGSGLNSYEAYTPAFINKKGLNIAFLRSSDRTGQYNNAQPYLQAGYDKSGFAYMTPYYISKQIEAVQGVADLKVVEMHAGSEYSISPGSGYDKSFIYDEDITQDEDFDYRTDVPHLWDIAIRQYAIDAGADIVIVHHPHIIQALEMYNGKLIAHSLGNYTFDLDYPECWPSMILYADADLEGFSNYRVVPIFLNDYIPYRATGELGIYLLDYIAMKSSERNTVFAVDKELGEGFVIPSPATTPLATSQHSIQRTLAPQADTFYATPPTKLPRQGSISSITGIDPIPEAEVRLGRELVWYGNFEDEGGTAWQIDTFSTNDFIGGTRSAMLVPSAGQTTTAPFKKRMKLYSQDRLSLHGWIKTRNITTANVVVRFYSSRTSSIVGSQTLTTDLSGTNGWQWFNVEITPQSNYLFFDIRLEAYSASGGNVFALFDNVGLIQWTEWQASSQLQNIVNPNDYYWIQSRTTEKIKSLTLNFSENRYLLSPVRATPQDLPLSNVMNLAAYPNPFNPNTTISFVLREQDRIQIDIYNIKGQKVKSLEDGQLSAGEYRYLWNGKDQQGKKTASGVYLIRVKNSLGTSIRKVMLMK